MFIFNGMENKFRKPLTNNAPTFIFTFVKQFWG